MSETTCSESCRKVCFLLFSEIVMVYGAGGALSLNFQDGTTLCNSIGTGVAEPHHFDLANTHLYDCCR